MKKLSLYSVVFSTFLVVVCAAILHDDLRAQSAAGSASDMDPHMGMRDLLPKSGIPATSTNVGFYGALHFALFMIGWGIALV